MNAVLGTKYIRNRKGILYSVRNRGQIRKGILYWAPNRTVKLNMNTVFLDALHRGALREACVAGVIPKEVVMLALAGHNVPAIFLPAELPTGNAKKKLKEATTVVMMHDNHYVGMIINKTIRKLEIYDSERRQLLFSSPPHRYHNTVMTLVYCFVPALQIDYDCLPKQ